MFENGRYSRPEVGVIIATYKRPHLIERALESVMRQTLPPQQIIVIDDCSGDNTGEVVLNWSRRTRCYPQFIKMVQNRGVGIARNMAFAQLRTPLVAFLDSDDEYHPDALEKLAAPLMTHENATVSFADAAQVWPDGRPPVSLMRRCLTAGVDTQSIDGAPATWQKLRDPQSALLLTSMIPTCAAMFRRSAADAVYLMPDYRHGEDWIFWLKLTETGDFICQFEDVATVHRGDDNQTSSKHDARNAQLTLNAMLALRRGTFRVALTPENRVRLDAAIAAKTIDMRYHSSREGIAAYWRMLGSEEAQTMGNRLEHLLADPKSFARAFAHVSGFK